MPNEKVLREKKLAVEELTKKLQSQAGVFVDYSGINVNDDTAMRVKLRESNIEYTVIKNTLMRFAINNVGYEDLDQILHGTTSLAVSNDDPVAPARVIKEFADQFQGFFEIKGGFMDGKVLSVNEVNALAAIPPLKTLYAQLLGTMLSPIASLTMVVNAASEKSNESTDEENSISVESPAEAAADALPDQAQETEATDEADSQNQIDASSATPLAQDTDEETAASDAEEISESPSDTDDEQEN